MCASCVLQILWKKRTELRVAPRISWEVGSAVGSQAQSVWGWGQRTHSGPYDLSLRSTLIHSLTVRHSFTHSSHLLTYSFIHSLTMHSFTYCVVINSPFTHHSPCVHSLCVHSLTVFIHSLTMRSFTHCSFTAFIHSPCIHSLFINSLHSFTHLIHLLISHLIHLLISLIHLIYSFTDSTHLLLHSFTNVHSLIHLTHSLTFTHLLTLTHSLIPSLIH